MAPHASRLFAVNTRGGGRRCLTIWSNFRRAPFYCCCCCCCGGERFSWCITCCCVVVSETRGLCSATCFLTLDETGWFQLNKWFTLVWFFLLLLPPPTPMYSHAHLFFRKLLVIPAASARAKGSALHDVPPALRLPLLINLGTLHLAAVKICRRFRCNFFFFPHQIKINNT